MAYMHDYTYVEILEFLFRTADASSLPLLQMNPISPQVAPSFNGEIPRLHGFRSIVDLFPAPTTTDKAFVPLPGIALYAPERLPSVVFDAVRYPSSHEMYSIEIQLVVA